MPDLRPQSVAGGTDYPAGPGATGAGVDVLAELERVRANLVALAERFEDLRTKYNGHTHGGALAAPPAGEQSQVAFTLS